MAAELITLGIVTTIAAGGGVVVWAREIFRTVRDVTSGDCGEEAMLRAERALAIADIVVLAALADQRISDRELAVLRELRVESRATQKYATAEVVSSWEGAEHAYATIEETMRTIRAVAAPLSLEERVHALQLVVRMQPDDAKKESPGGPYRGAVPVEIEIVPLVAAALGLEVGDGA